MQNQDRLLRCLASADITPDSLKHLVEEIGPELDWAYFFNQARREGVLALAFNNLSRIESADRLIPEETRKQMKSFYYTVAARNSLLSEQLKKLLSAFNQAGIKLILLKGIALAHTVYPNIALRPMDDIDILVRREDLPAANQVLISLGYLSPANYEDSLVSSPDSSINTLVYGGGRTATFFIHLHWHLINTTWPLGRLVSAIDMQRIWSAALPLKIEGSNTWKLLPEHQLIYLCQHAFAHGFKRLILIYDIAQVLRTYQEQLDWDLVIQEAQRFNLSQILYCSLRLTSRLLDYDIPALNRLRPVHFSLFERMLSYFISRGIRSQKLSYLTYLSMQGWFFGKLRFIARTVFPPPDIMAHKLTLPLSQINSGHYYRRLVHIFFKS
ncbi:nucleotidyltransferase family protein [Candidatus Omnitrophota bacterium]